MINIKIRKEMDEISSYLDILKDNLINITSSQLKALEECIEQEIKAAKDTEELSFITDLVYNSLKDIMKNSKIDVDAPLEDNIDDIKVTTVPSGSTANMEDITIKNALNENKIVPNEDLSPLSKLFTVDSFGNRVYIDNDLESKDPKEVTSDSVYVIDLNKVKAEEDSINTSADLDIPENTINLNNVDSVENNNDEPVVLDNEKKDELTTDLSSIEYSQNVIKNQVDDIKDNLAITTPDINNIESLMASSNNQSSIDPLAELANAKVEPSILDNN